MHVDVDPIRFCVEGYHLRAQRREQIRSNAISRTVGAIQQDFQPTEIQTFLGGKQILQVKIIKFCAIHPDSSFGQVQFPRRQAGEIGFNGCFLALGKFHPLRIQELDAVL